MLAARGLANLETLDDLRGRADTAVRLNERFLELLPDLLVARVTERGREVARERLPALRERVAKPAEPPPLRLRDRRRTLFVAEELGPASRQVGLRRSGAGWSALRNGAGKV